MGATVFNRARVWTTSLSNGQLAYLWEENTHCIKDGPKAADWCAMKFGTQKAMVKRIYSLATSIPGGMLKVGGRRPEKFVSDMLALLREPLELTPAVAELENTKNGFYSAINDSNRQAAHQKLIELDRDDLAEAIRVPHEEGGIKLIKLDPLKDFIVIDALVNDFTYIDRSWGYTRGIAPWKLFRKHGRGSEERKGPVEPVPMYKPACAPDVRLYRTKIDASYAGSREPQLLHILAVDGKVLFFGRDDYSLEVQLIEYCGERHASEGVFIIKDAFKALEAARADAHELPLDFVFKFHSPSEKRWDRENFDCVACAINGTTSDSLQVTHEQLASLHQIARDKLRYLVEATVHGSCVVDVELQALTQQPELFA